MSACSGRQSDDLARSGSKNGAPDFPEGWLLVV
jgi:hypothetical protein